MSLIAKTRHRLPLRKLAKREDGMTIVEFALVAPTFLMLLLGTLDIAQLVYAQSVLNGAVQTAAREASLEGADTTAADDLVLQRIDGINLWDILHRTGRC